MKNPKESIVDLKELLEAVNNLFGKQNHIFGVKIIQEMVKCHQALKENDLAKV